MRRPGFGWLLLLMLTTGLAPFPLNAATLDDPNHVGWFSYRDLTSAQFSARFLSLRDDYRVIDVEAYEVDEEMRYAGIWQRNDDNLRWASWRDLTHDQYHQRWEQYRDEGLRPIDVEAYRVGNASRYAGVWVENTEGLRWASYRNLTNDDFVANFERHRSGFLPIDIEASPAENANRYAVIWVENRDDLAWKEYRNMSASSYASRFEQFREQGFRVLDLDSYRQNGEQRYAAIWVENENQRGWAAWRDMSSRSWANRWRGLNDQGFRPIDIDVYPGSTGERYLGVWRQNGERHTWGPKQEIDERVQRFKQRYDLPAISVVIAHQGAIRYRRGFGEADLEAQKVAWSRTLYRTASVCKPVTALVALRLADRGVIDLDRPSREYLPSLPSHHSHNLRQLLSHRGCVRHYKSGDPVNASRPPMERSQDALGLFQDDPLQGFDNDGNQICDEAAEAYSYSTHAFTILAAAMERATGDTPYRWLLRSEIAGPFGIGTLRQEDRNVSRYERAQIYGSGNHVISNPNDITWKLAGGGCEISTMDLARLGMAVAEGRVLPSDRQTEMWTAPDTLNSNYGLGWALGTHQGQAVRSHTGSQQGANSAWRIYPSEPLVVAVMINRTVQAIDNDSTGNLARDLAAIVLDF